jgi:hypothetical protein
VSKTEEAARLRAVLTAAGYGPDLDTGDLLLHLAAGIYVMEGHAGCAPAVLDVHLAGWSKAFKAEGEPPC